MKNSFEIPLLGKKTLEYLAELSRIEISEERKAKSEKLLKDLQKILVHFEELKKVNTKNVEPMAGGTVIKNIFREDAQNSKLKAKSSKLIEAFPEEENGFLKVPAVFE